MDLPPGLSCWTDRQSSPLQSCTDAPSPELQTKPASAVWLQWFKYIKGESAIKKQEFILKTKHFRSKEKKKRDYEAAALQNNQCINTLASL